MLIHRKNNEEVTFRDLKLKPRIINELIWCCKEIWADSLIVDQSITELIQTNWNWKPEIIITQRMKQRQLIRGKRQVNQVTWYLIRNFLLIGNLSLRASSISQCLGQWGMPCERCRENINSGLVVGECLEDKLHTAATHLESKHKFT